MSRAQKERRVALSNRHITAAKVRVQRQREMIATLERTGQDTTEARKLLSTMEEVLGRMKAEGRDSRPS
jgi:hypothetical protein